MEERTAPNCPTAWYNREAQEGILHTISGSVQTKLKIISFNGISVPSNMRKG